MECAYFVGCKKELKKNFSELSGKADTSRQERASFQHEIESQEDGKIKVEKIISSSKREDLLDEQISSVESSSMPNGAKRTVLSLYRKGITGKYINNLLKSKINPFKDTGREVLSTACELILNGKFGRKELINALTSEGKSNSAANHHASDVVYCFMTMGVNTRIDFKEEKVEEPIQKKPYLYTARSHFSIGESLLSPKKIALIAKAQGYSSVALVDTMTISGMTEFIGECKKQDLKYIIGCRLRVVMDCAYAKPSRTALELPKQNPEWYPKVFVKNQEGMLELMKLLSLANSSERFNGNARISFDDLLLVLKNGNLIFSTGDIQSVFSLNLKAYNYQSLLDKLNSEILQQNSFIELLNFNSLLSDTLNKKAYLYAFKSKNRILATGLMLYEKQEDADTLDVLTAISSNSKMTDAWRNIQQAKEFYSKSDSQVQEEISELINGLEKRGVGCSGLSESLGNFAEELIEACQYEWSSMPVSLPKMAEDEHAEIMKHVVAGWAKRIKSPVMGYLPPPELIPKYKERLVYELGILRKMGFERYFLLVQDVVSWSKENKILVGPGRGSVGGSLVAYLMGITDVDPIRFSLLFERFINPDRLDLPDADLDFMSTRREEVIEYLVKKYGKEKVAGITNYGTMASASALRDCGRVFGLSQEQLSATRYVPKENGTSYELEAAAAVVPELEAFKKSNGMIWNHAIRLEGVMRSLGKHAAGIVVADEPISNRAVVETRSESSVVNWDRNSVESWGLVKMDLLGLSTLDTLRIALDYIKENHGEELDLLNIPIDDVATMKELSEGRTIGVFQLESGGMRHLLKDLAKGGLLNFEDICATTALYRPGPMESGMLETYVRVRQGLDYPEYDHPKMIPALEATMGVFIYQEQTMQVARDLAGFTMAEADVLRKAVGKKDASKMATMKDRFVSGCSAGFVEVEMDDGSVVTINRSQKLKVKEGGEFTIEDIIEKSLTLLDRV